ncbi:hypothetical protein CCICO_01545 [Corynebacterium ciconiae DSM 44920]|uniref:hypothetical protein n=1 Tax=Corynebacterium ciconiae TaxID=227319 RepID=UPI0003AB1F5B|nr:hypothetical protein [Corynebacterium ciconiae]WKD60363.1 hypothetical protein CCICO_01545 [Corynebacterium ciconiae DSM 44920]
MTSSPPTFSLNDLAGAVPQLVLLTPRFSSTTAHGVCGVQDLHGDAADGWVVVLDPESSEPLRRQFLRLHAASACIIPDDAHNKAELVSTAHSVQRALVTKPRSVSTSSVILAAARLATDRPSNDAATRLRITDKLSPTLISDTPELSLLQEFKALSGESVATFDSHIRLRANVGELPVRTIARQLMTGTLPSRSIHLGRWSIQAHFVEQGQASRWFVRGLRSGMDPDPRSVAARTTIRMLRTISAHEARQQLSNHVEAADLLHNFCSPTSDQMTLENSLRLRGFARDSKMRLILAGAAGDGHDPELFASAIGVASSAAVPYVAGPLFGWLGFLTTDNPHVIEIARSLTHPAGISDPITRLDAGAQALREARTAHSTPRNRGVCTFSHCLPLERASAKLTYQELEDSVREVVKVLADIPDGPNVASALVSHNAATGATASALGVHPNSVRRRTKYILDQSGLSLADLGLWHIWWRQRST